MSNLTNIKRSKDKCLDFLSYWTAHGEHTGNTIYESAMLAFNKLDAMHDEERRKQKEQGFNKIAEGLKL